MEGSFLRMLGMNEAMVAAGMLADNLLYVGKFVYFTAESPQKPSAKSSTSKTVGMARRCS
eukprot:16079-Heterococcus_DN1.PRE.2